MNRNQLDRLNIQWIGLKYSHIVEIVLTRILLKNFILESDVCVSVISEALEK